MVSAIDPTKPTTGTALTADVRANFQAAKTEIEALQSGKQPQSDRLAALVALTLAANKLIYATSQTTFDVADFTAFARSLLVAADAPAARTILGAAPLASPAFSGTPTSPTPAAGNSSTQIATTAFVAGELTNKQAGDPTLTALAALTTAANKLIYATGVDTFATADLTAFARTLLDDADAATALATLGAAAAGHAHTAAADVYAAVKLILAQGNNVTVTANDTAKTLTVASQGSSGSSGAFTGAATKSANYSVVQSDGGGVIKCSAAITLTLPAASGLPAGWWVQLSNRSTGAVQIARTGSDTINGLSSGFVLRSGEDITVYQSSSSAFDVLTLGRSVTEGQGSWNPSAKGGGITLSNNNLTAAADQNLNTSVRANVGASTGKRYYEMIMNSANGVIAGLMNTSGNLNGQFPQDANGWAYYHDGRRGTGGSSGAYGSSLSNGSVLRIAVDLDAGKLFFGVGSIWQGSADPVAGTNPAFTSVSGTLYPAFSRDGTGAPAGTIVLNLSSFNYSPPTGYTTFY